MKRLLIMSCSSVKKADEGVMPALERYDGPSYRVVRAHKAQGRRLPRVLILSSLYGLIEAKHPIRTYDQKLDDKTASVLIRSRADRQMLVSAVNAADDIFVHAGGLYLDVLTSWGGSADGGVPAWRVAAGAPGQRLAGLKEWLGRVG